MARLQFTGNSSALSKALGLPSLLAGIALLAWNEYHQAHVGRLYDEAEQSLTALTDTTRVDPALEGKMVHFDAWALVGDSVCDSLYGVGGYFLAVERKVEYHQWVQHQTPEEYFDREGNKQVRTRYYYEHEWCDKPVDSEKFHNEARQNYRNFALTDVTSTTAYSPGAHIGPYELSHELVDSAAAAPPGSVPFDSGTARFQAAVDSTTRHGEVLCHLMGDTLYYGDHPYSPIVGDVRVIFLFRPACHAWVMAQPHGNVLRPFHASDDYWFTFFRFSDKQFDPEVVIDQERWGQKWLRWSLRVLGWLLIVWGIKGIFSWLVGFFRRIPIIGPVFELGLSAVAWVAGTILALLTIGVAFIVVRPWLGWTITGLLLIGLVGGSILYRRAHPVVPPPLPQQPMQQPMQQVMPQCPQQPRMPQQPPMPPTPPPLP